MTDELITITSWKPIIANSGYAYSIQGHSDSWGVSLYLFLTPEKVLNIPFQKNFASAQEALEWLGNADPFVGYSSKTVNVYGDDAGAFLTAWEMERDEE